MKDELENFIRDYVKNYKRNKNTTTDWNEPIVVFADAKDVLFKKLKKIIGYNHALPSDFLKDAKTVISYFLPLKKETVLSNVNGNQASKEWALAYIETNQLIVDLNQSISEMLKKQGFNSAVTPPTHNFNKEKLVSDWSHKHIAHIAGLGKFGTHNMIITERGCCGRLGSIVSNAKIEPTKRVDDEICLYKIDKSCGLCVEKCIFGALKLNSFDRHECYKQCLENAKIYSKLGLVDVCGKCAADVPCSYENPIRN